MNCNDCRDLIVTGIYGTLSSREKKDLEGHVEACPECARTLRELGDYQGLLVEKEEIPLPDWERSWEVISESMRRPQKHRIVYILSPRTIYAAAAVIVVFITGLLIGKHFMGPTREIILSTPESVHSSYYIPVSNYAESIEPILVNFTNRGAYQLPEELLEMEREIIDEMRSQTMLLRYLASRSGDLDLQYLLEDLEIILVSIANLRKGDEDAARQLEHFIRERAVTMRLRQIMKEESTI